MATATAKKTTDLTVREVKVLKALRKTRYGVHELTRKQLAERTGYPKGWSKLLGQVTQQDPGPETMEGRKLIRSAMYEGDAKIYYSITKKGLKLIS